MKSIVASFLFVIAAATLLLFALPREGLADDAAFLEEASEEVGRLIEEALSANLPAEELTSEPVREQIEAIKNIFVTPLREMPPALQTPANLEWYRDSVLFHLVEYSSPESWLRQDAADMDMHERDFSRTARGAFRLMEEEGITREKVGRIALSLDSFSEEAAREIANYIRSLDDVYIHHSHVPEHVSDFARELTTVEPMPGTEDLFEFGDQSHRQAGVLEVLMAVYLEEELEKTRQTEVGMHKLILQDSLFAVAGYLGDGIPDPDSMTMTEARRERLRELLADSIGEEQMVIGALEYLDFSLLGYYDLAFSTVFAEELAGSSSSLRGGVSETPEENPKAFIRLRFASPPVHSP